MSTEHCSACGREGKESKSAYCDRCNVSMLLKLEALHNLSHPKPTFRNKCPECNEEYESIEENNSKCQKCIFNEIEEGLQSELRLYNIA
jgi:DNA-directed RNA polymerase subunit RPC12/RpoP